MRLSVIIPVYNERTTLPRVLVDVCAALPGVDKEIMIVDDGSTDGTREWLRANFPSGPRVAAAASLDDRGDLCFADHVNGARTTFCPVYRKSNDGKGAALRDGFARASGDVFVIQDADLEYHPNDWGVMYSLIAERRVADVVYGSRFYCGANRFLFLHHYLANRVISFLFSVLYNQALTDIEVAYKMITASVMRSLQLTSNDFGIEIEMSAGIVRQRDLRIREVTVSYCGRTYEEGKKVNWKDGVKALWYLLKFRFR
jgi:glycosyltransferase involved in cell wall biosynthesis